MRYSTRVLVIACTFGLGAILGFQFRDQQTPTLYDAAETLSAGRDRYVPGVHPKTRRAVESELCAWRKFVGGEAVCAGGWEFRVLMDVDSVGESGRVLATDTVAIRGGKEASLRLVAVPTGLQAQAPGFSTYYGGSQSDGRGALA